MTLATCTLIARVTDDAGNPLLGANLESLSDDLMAALMRLEAVDSTICDATIAATFDRGLIEIDLSVEAATAEDAIVKAAASIRAAVHEIGVRTPGWEFDVVQARVQREDLDDDRLVEI